MTASSSVSCSLTRSVSNHLLLKETVIFKILKNKIQLNDKIFEEIIKGAFVVVDHDNGEVYDSLLNNKKLASYHRTSSHHSLSKNNSNSTIINGKCIGKSQMAIDGIYFRSFLFGKIRCPENIKHQGDPMLYTKKINNKLSIYQPPKNYKICTWFQFESSRWGSPDQTLYDTLFHCLDYLYYIFKGNNKGPLGNSEFTGRPMTWNPLVTKNKKHQKEHQRIQHAAPQRINQCNAKRILVK